jgi:3-mercaptopyruvate sulfurtransferase SseA
MTVTAAGTLALGLLALAGPARAESEPFGRLEVDEVEKLLGAPDVRIYDVNSAEVYAKGHVPGAIWSALDGVERVLPADRTMRLIFYCKNTH